MFLSPPKLTTPVKLLRTCEKLSCLMRVFNPSAPLSKVMCFHPWSDVTLPLMKNQEVVEVIDKWAELVEELGTTYRWVQVGLDVGDTWGCVDSSSTLRTEAGRCRAQVLLYSWLETTATSIDDKIWTLSTVINHVMFGWAILYLDTCCPVRKKDLNSENTAIWY